MLNFLFCSKCQTHIDEINHNLDLNENVTTIDNINTKNNNIIRVTSSLQNNPFQTINIINEKVEDDLNIIEYPYEHKNETIPINEISSFPQTSMINNKVGNTIDQLDDCDCTLVDNSSVDINLNNKLNEKDDKCCIYCSEIYKQVHNHGYILNERPCIYCNKMICQKTYDILYSHNKTDYKKTKSTNIFKINFSELNKDKQFYNLNTKSSYPFQKDFNNLSTLNNNMILEDGYKLSDYSLDPSRYDILSEDHKNIENINIESINDNIKNDNHNNNINLDINEMDKNENIKKDIKNNIKLNIKENKDIKDIKDIKDNEDNYKNEENNKDKKENEDNNKDYKENKENEEDEENKENKENEDNKDNKNNEDNKDNYKNKENEDNKDNKENKDNEGDINIKDKKNKKNNKNYKNNKDNKDNKDNKNIYNKNNKVNINNKDKVEKDKNISEENCFQMHQLMKVKTTKEIRKSKKI